MLAQAEEFSGIKCGRVERDPSEFGCKRIFLGKQRLRHRLAATRHHKFLDLQSAEFQLIVRQLVVLPETFFLRRVAQPLPLRQRNGVIGLKRPEEKDERPDALPAHGLIAERVEGVPRREGRALLHDTGAGGQRDGGNERCGDVLHGGLRVFRSLGDMQELHGRSGARVHIPRGLEGDAGAQAGILVPRAVVRILERQFLLGLVAVHGLDIVIE